MQNCSVLKLVNFTNVSTDVFMERKKEADRDDPAADMMQFAWERTQRRLSERWGGAKSFRSRVWKARYRTQMLEEVGLV